MLITINPDDSVPIYLQIVSCFRRAIVSGILSADEKLPSVRDVALQIQVNPNTVSRAFQQMEIEGMVYTKRGQGTFVKKIDTEILEEKSEEIFTKSVRKTLQTAVELNLTPDQIKTIFLKILTHFTQNRIFKEDK